jgi:hypothetical protein
MVRNHGQYDTLMSGDWYQQKCVLHEDSFWIHPSGLLKKRGNYGRTIQIPQISIHRTVRENLGTSCRQGDLWHEPTNKNLSVSTKRKFAMTSETMEEFCLVKSVTSLNGPNTEMEDDGKHHYHSFTHTPRFTISHHFVFYSYHCRWLVPHFLRFWISVFNYSRYSYRALWGRRLVDFLSTVTGQPEVSLGRPLFESGFDHNWVSYEVGGV